MTEIKIYSRVKFPQQRGILIACLQELADRSIQIKEWVKPDYPHSFSDYAYLNIAFLFDDIAVYEYPQESIGYVTMKQQELGALKLVYESLEKVCSNIGPNQPDSAYINNPLWDDVIKASQKAYAVFMQTEEESKKIHPTPWDGEEDWLEKFPED